MKILDLGCGLKKHKIEGAEVVGLDKFKLDGVDVVWDLENTPLPFEDNEFDEIIAEHVLEHITNFYPLMEDLHRILKPNGILRIRCPHGGTGMSEHPDHKRAFSQHSFKHFRPGYSKGYITNAKFDIVKIRFNFMYPGSRWDFLNFLFNPFLNFWKGFTEKFFPHLIAEIYFELKAVK